MPDDMDAARMAMEDRAGKEYYAGKGEPTPRSEAARALFAKLQREAGIGQRRCKRCGYPIEE